MSAQDDSGLLGLLDKEAIREVLYRYCRAADRCDVVLLKSCYHEDAMDNHGFFCGKGHDFAEYVVGQLKQIELSVHSITNTIIELDGARASVESQWSVIHRVRRWFLLTDMWHHGRYLDLFEKRNGEWKILKRISVVDADRWLSGVDIGSLTPPNSTHQLTYGSRYPNDHVYHQRELLTGQFQELPPVDPLWKPLKALVSIPKWLISLVSWHKKRPAKKRVFRFSR